MVYLGLMCPSLWRLIFRHLPIFARFLASLTDEKRIESQSRFFDYDFLLPKSFYGSNVRTPIFQPVCRIRLVLLRVRSFSKNFGQKRSKIFQPKSWKNLGLKYRKIWVKKIEHISVKKRSKNLGQKGRQILVKKVDKFRSKRLKNFDQKGPIYFGQKSSKHLGQKGRPIWVKKVEKVRSKRSNIFRSKKFDKCSKNFGQTVEKIWRKRVEKICVKKSRKYFGEKSWKDLGQKRSKKIW